MSPVLFPGLISAPSHSNHPPPTPIPLHQQKNLPSPPEPTSAPMAKSTVASQAAAKNAAPLPIFAATGNPSPIVQTRNIGVDALKRHLSHPNAGRCRNPVMTALRDEFLETMAGRETTEKETRWGKLDHHELITKYDAFLEEMNVGSQLSENNIKSKAPSA
ncbi:hypothetical protein R3P38DRAFT_2812236 [Favolaschia claudopus]|uniref:Uncharacterized protein n=1 Tax=Favolaschia claudopus TaxID=2862362 RepID=A0AAV9Z726_9AGAR